MKKRIVTLLVAASLAATVFAGCGSDKADKKTADTTTTAESQADDTDAADESGMTADGRFADVDAYLANDTVKQQLDSAMASTEDGANLEVLSEKDTLIYRYTFDEQFLTDDLDADTVKASFEQAVAQQDSTMQAVADGLVECIAVSPIKVRVEYIDADGTSLYEKEYTSAN